ncbi:AraC-type DNA-binding protein [Robiginitalea myxolifaciens]|uniref:AraC-type DNA-binding protein n=2 Tax=Robiginitalea myxolifaciens TaxID=400055 RepID=A0A1I6FN98_9FLAO|nr:AraC-type DNA-binding protein [Robiginitalea myxolifaciens]
MEILIDAKSTAGTVQQIQEFLGGEILERWGETTLNIDNEKAIGSIRYITFDWGVSLLEYDIEFKKPLTLIMDASQYNPIHFAYCLEGHCFHRFESQVEKRKLEQFQSVIITSTDGGYNYGYFPADMKLQINVIQIVRKQFLQKRLNNVSLLNQRLYHVFLDTDHNKAFAYFGTFNLKLADKIKALRSVKQKGMIRILQIEGMVYQILSMHIQQHDREATKQRIETTLLKRELQVIRRLAGRIIKNPSKAYSISELSVETGISQAKLQEGFKLLYTKTVNEYIRHVRLEAARDYMVNTDMNISQIVYTIGFTSRSYFSKIFKQKFGISPSEFRKNKLPVVEKVAV